MSSILKSAALIRSIKTRGFIPESQRTFEAQDFLDIATEKINISLMKEIITARGDYLVYFEDTPLEEGVTNYAIPDRAHGDKLRDACIVDSEGKTKRELTQISLENLTDYQTDYVTYTTYDPFYLQNNEVVLINTNFRSGDSLRMYFYMRPNKLVIENRAMTASSITQSVEIDTISPKSGTISAISLSGVITSANHGLADGNQIVITGADSDPAVDGTYKITYIDSNSFSIPTTVTVPGTTGTWNLAAQVVYIPSLNFPKHFTSELLFDIVNCKSPNNIKLYNISANSLNNTTKSISFRVADVGTKIIVGDYITSAEETIVPNVPTEYHPVIAQMVAVHCMESMADEQQKKSALATLEQMKDDVLSIVQNRVEGAPKKIKNRSSTLDSATRRNRFYRRRG
jgi:hypothetical protein